MPCYAERDHQVDPWDADRERNEIRAVQILCKQVTAAINSNSQVDHELLKWYIDHRTIDLAIALSGAGDEPIDSIKVSIDKARFLLT